MKENEIRKILLRHHIDFAIHGTIWGTMIPSIGAYNNGFGEVMHMMKDHILHINSNGLAIIAVDDINGKPKGETLMYIPREKILSSSLRKMLFKYIFTIETDKGSIQYKLRKNILMCPWHKENLFYLIFGVLVSEKRDCL